MIWAIASFVWFMTSSIGYGLHLRATRNSKLSRFWMACTWATWPVSIPLLWLWYGWIRLAHVVAGESK